MGSGVYYVHKGGPRDLYEFNIKEVTKDRTCFRCRKKDVYRILLKSQEKVPSLKKLGVYGEGKIKTDCLKIKYESVDWIQLARDRLQR
jgi:ribosomal protein L13